MADGKGCIQGTKIEGRVKNLEDDMSEVKTAIQQMRDKLLNRPPWVIVFLLSGMMSLIVGLVMAIIKMN